MQQTGQAEFTLPKPVGEAAAQAAFDELYISTGEICERMGVERSTVLNARRNGQLPDPILVANFVYIWERKFIEPYLVAWKHQLDVRFGRAL